MVQKNDDGYGKYEIITFYKRFNKKIKTLVKH